ncbi:MAG: hypothetical protein HY398_00065 [Candidatus Doudnabacteria bacterium]|nr:hypothetical protein [Candidatus Doudnabacteria bacterium]
MKKLLLIICLSFILISPFFALAAESGLGDTGFETVCKKGGELALGACIANIYKLSLGLGAVVALFMTILAGYRYMNAAGNAEQVESAKESFTYAITGLIILFVAYALLYTINPDLVKFRKVGDIGKLPAIVFQAPAPPITGPAIDLAKQIQGLAARITLAMVHASGNSDNATARKNIDDTAEGREALHSCYGTAPCKSVALDETMLGAMIELAKTYSFSVSEIAGGAHSANSAHYAGRAFDVNYINGTRVNASHPSQQAFRDKCRTLGAVQYLGPGAAGHSTHIHCAWAAGGTDIGD